MKNKEARDKVSSTILYCIKPCCNTLYYIAVNEITLQNTIPYFSTLQLIVHVIFEGDPNPRAPIYTYVYISERVLELKGLSLSFVQFLWIPSPA